MIFKNIENQGVYLYVHDIDLNVPKTGDAANISGSFSLDGELDIGNEGRGDFLDNVVEIANGIYYQPLAQAETNGNTFSYWWVSTTDNVSIEPIIGFTEGGKILKTVYIVGGSRVLNISNGEMTLAGGTDYEVVLVAKDKNGVPVSDEITPIVFLEEPI